MAEILEYLKVNQEAYTVIGILLTLLFSLISLCSVHGFSYKEPCRMD